MSMTEAAANYATRLDYPEAMKPRREPVVHDSPLRDAGPLSPEHLGDYEERGYLNLDSIFTSAEVALFQGELERLRSSEEVRQSELAVTEPMSGATRSVYGVHTVSPVFDALSRDPRLLNAVRQILGSEVYLHQTRVNFKPGFRGKEFYWHSDFETWHAEDGMPGMRAIGVTIALSDRHEFNGPLMVIPGSHRYFLPCVGRTPEHHYQQSLKRQDYGVPEDEHLEFLVNKLGIDAPDGAPGSLLLSDCNLIHGSNGNMTPYPRSSVNFVYNSMENTLGSPFAAEEERPWYLANREPQAVQPAEAP